MAGFRVPNANQGGGGPKDCVTVPRKLASNAFLSPDYDHAFFAIMSSSRFHGKTRFLIHDEVKTKKESWIQGRGIIICMGRSSHLKLLMKAYM